jgi:acylphosphatase
MRNQSGVRALRVWVNGRVQGVFFRDSTRQRAHELDLGGWVRNLGDGRVEALFVGSAEACEQGLEFVRTGPPGARVDTVEHRWETPPEPLPSSFRIRY